MKELRLSSITIGEGERLSEPRLGSSEEGAAKRQTNGEGPHEHVAQLLKSSAEEGA